MAHDLGISPHDLNETLWMLQKQQIVTFRERKGPKGSVITRIRIADTILNGATLETITNVVRTDDEVIDHAIDFALDVLEVADDITREAKVTSVTSPAARLKTLLQETGHPLNIRDANIRLGYGRLSTAIYSLHKTNPGVFVLDKGTVGLAEPKDVNAGALKHYETTPCTNRQGAPEWCVEHDSLWHKGDMYCVREWERRNAAIETMAEAGADAQNDASTTPTEPMVDDATNDLPVILVPPTIDGFPHIQALIAESGSQGAARKAADILSDAGLDSLALTVIEAVRSFTPLENEVIALAAILGWLGD
jgi:hypothetical protein